MNKEFNYEEAKKEYFERLEIVKVWMKENNIKTVDQGGGNYERRNRTNIR
jgi:hypothetical protein